MKPVLSAPFRQMIKAAWLRNSLRFPSTDRFHRRCLKAAECSDVRAVTEETFEG